MKSWRIPKAWYKARESIVLGLALSTICPAWAVSIPKNAVPANAHWACEPEQSGWSCHQTLDYSHSVYDQSLSSMQHRAAVADALGWIPDDSDSNAQYSACGGHYDEAKFNPAYTGLPLASAKSDVSFGHSIYKAQGSYTLSNGVRIVQPNRIIYADTISLTPNLKTHKLDSIKAVGHVKVQQPGQIILADRLSANLADNQAHAQDVTYLTKIDRSWRQNPIDPDDQNFTGYAHGTTTAAEQLDENTFVLHDATYATCAPTDNTWRLDTSKMVLNRKSGRGHAYNVTLKAHGVPVFYWPFLSFPISAKRQTGFLYGSVGQSTRTGYFMSTPFYMNLAPNLDDTFTPTFYTKRGVSFGNNFRYLLGPNKISERTEGQIDINYMPADYGYEPNHHIYVSTDNNMILSPRWQAGLSGAYVSDKMFMDDFVSGTSLTGANVTLLDQKFHMNYHSSHWNFTGLIQQYQVVDTTLLLDNRPYKRLPELDLTSYFPHILAPLSIKLDTQFVNFFKSSADGLSPTNGQRYMASPTVSLPLRNSYAFFTPAVTFDNTYYTLQNSVANGFTKSRISRSIPIVDVDTGLIFARPIMINHSSYRQTLEPRLFYLFAPDVDQNDIPVFDTTINDFSFSQLFATNRFAGNDRIGDANQLSLALTSNLYNEQGRKVWDAGIGEIFYFKHRDVSLCNQGQNPGCLNTEQPFHDTARSDIAGQMNYHMNPDWLFHSDITYNPNNGNFDNQNYQFQYQPDSHHLFNFGYQANNYDYSLLSTQQILQGQTPPRLSQITASTYWSLSNTLSVIGYWDYSVNANRTLDIFGGLEYNSCSWAIRFIVRRYIENSNPNIPIDLNGATSTLTMLQFELKGLGTMGSSGLSDLVKEIPGYGQNKAGSL